MKKLLLMLLASGIGIQTIEAAARRSKRIAARAGLAAAPEQGQEAEDNLAHTAKKPCPYSALHNEGEEVSGIDWATLRHDAEEVRMLRAAVERCEKCGADVEKSVVSEHCSALYGPFDCAGQGCGICREELGLYPDSGEKIAVHDLPSMLRRATRCGHAYHTPCFEEMEKNNWECVRCRRNIQRQILLLKLNGPQRRADLFLQLYVAAQVGYLEPIEALLRMIEDVSSILGMQDGEGNTVLHAAVEGGSVHSVAALLNGLRNQQEQLTLLSTKNRQGISAFTKAILWQRQPIIDYLVNCFSEEQIYPLLRQVHIGQRNALMAAVMTGDESMVRALLKKITPEKLVNLLAQPNVEEVSTLLAAASNDEHEVTSVLLEKLSSDQILSLLRMQKNRRGISVLMGVAERGKTAMIESLLEKVSLEEKIFLLEQRSVAGNTPLIFAASHGHKSVIKTLLDRLPAERRLTLINLTNNKGTDALHFAQQKGHWGIVRLLQQYLKDDALGLRA